MPVRAPCATRWRIRNGSGPPRRTASRPTTSPAPPGPACMAPRWIRARAQCTPRRRRPLLSTTEGNLIMQLKDKVAFITGSASGIGKEIAIVFAREGAKIVIADLNKQAADATASELKASGAQAIGVGVDVTSEEQVDAAVEEAAKAFGGIDILISNAGIQIVHPVEEFS